MSVPANSDAIADRLAILDVLHRLCRGIDRMDREMTLSCWHPGGTDDHAPLYVGSAEGFVEWLWPVHAAMVFTRHAISNILVALDGDRAGTECYWAASMRIPSGGRLYDVERTGRYLDRFEKIGGVWAIRHRTSIREWSRAALVDAEQTIPVLIQPHNPEFPERRSRRDRDDPSYAVLSGLPIREPT